MSEKQNIVNVVQKTSDLSVFKLSRFNRYVILSKEMIEQAEAGFIAPIIVNEKMVVIDGQHRLEASRKLDLPVEYIVKPGLDRDDIVRMNTVQKPWSLENYIQSFANEGREEYIKLISLINSKYASVTETAQIASNMVGNMTRVGNSIKSGDFKFYNHSKAVEFLEYYKRFREETKTPKRSTVTTALYVLFRLEKIDKDRIIEKVNQLDVNEDIRVKTMRHTEMLKTLIDTYNNKLQTISCHYIDYHITSTGNLIINEDIAVWANKKAPVEGAE